MHFFQRLCTTTETCWIESINLGYNGFFATLTKIDKYIKFNNEVESIPDLGTKIWWTLHFEREIYFNTGDTSGILKHVKLLDLAEQNHGYLTTLHRIRSDKISDKERRVRKFPTFEMATMLWRHMVIKFDNDPGLLMVYIWSLRWMYSFFFCSCLFVVFMF